MPTAVKSQAVDSPAIQFKTELYTIGSWTILRLPAAASAKLPSRGQTMVDGTINGYSFQTPLEPDGKLSHWFRVDKSMQDAIKAAAGDTVAVTIQPIKDWPEPEVPADISKALKSAPSQVRALWENITPMSRWEWIRWIRATDRQETRQRRIEVGIFKLKSGERRPCCWNRNLCTEPSVSKSGVLMEPGQAK